MTNSSRVDTLKRAYLDGRGATPGAQNACAGDDYLLARVWRLGYRAMMAELIENSRAMRIYRRSALPPH